MEAPITPEEAKKQDTVKVETLTKEASIVAQEILKENKPVMIHQAVIAENKDLVINGQKVDLKEDILIDNARTMLPIRTIAEVFNLEVGYNSTLKIAIVVKDGVTLEFPIGSNVAIINGKEVVKIDEGNPDVRIIVAKDRTYLPVRFIAEQLGLQVDFKDNIISIQGEK